MYAAVAHLVERHLAKVEVASSSLVGRSKQSPRLKRKLQPGAFCFATKLYALSLGGRIGFVGNLGKLVKGQHGVKWAVFLEDDGDAVFFHYIQYGLVVSGGLGVETMLFGSIFIGYVASFLIIL